MLQASLAAIADPNRFRIVELLLDGPRAVNDIAESLQLNQPQVSKHLRVLKDTGWVDAEQRAQQRLYALQAVPLRELSEWLERYRRIWDERFTAMDDVIDELVSAEKKKPQRGRN